MKMNTSNALKAAVVAGVLTSGAIAQDSSGCGALDLCILGLFAANPDCGTDVTCGSICAGIGECDVSTCPGEIQVGIAPYVAGGCVDDGTGGGDGGDGDEDGGSGCPAFDSCIMTTMAVHGCTDLASCPDGCGGLLDCDLSTCSGELQDQVPAYVYGECQDGDGGEEWPECTNSCSESPSDCASMMQMMQGCASSCSTTEAVSMSLKLWAGEIIDAECLATMGSVAGLDWVNPESIEYVSMYAPSWPSGSCIESCSTPTSCSNLAEIMESDCASTCGDNDKAGTMLISLFQPPAWLDDGCVDEIMEEEENWPACVESCEEAPTSCEALEEIMTTGCGASCTTAESITASLLVAGGGGIDETCLAKVGQMTESKWMNPETIKFAMANGETWPTGSCAATCTASPESCDDLMAMFESGCAKSCDKTSKGGAMLLALAGGPPFIDDACLDKVFPEPAEKKDEKKDETPAPSPTAAPAPSPAPSSSGAASLGSIAGVFIAALAAFTA
mmetsp:Transcript_23741/g.28638  ORF Transcript_23741/g.28638 Transcript_23741/m.28638 type:complete len:503 (-) Transcript_23741:243-1751(-)|eukprot:CAMPEP_0197846966 /NCGR_PEP_ID=MMETSP1438-20131217/4752_1 /TAXON_ID=1461541 /ORGANISM="Pterosperma sp., Strain CCMP1384" /LENGTH=502 /DNA_ID=CAMNT_0043458757 /DNA_START=98 /DNA_END=1606 /DNA_ORIENTATION=+